MREFSTVFEGVGNPRRSNATRHSLHEMLMIALLSTLCGGEGCADMERFGRAKGYRRSSGGAIAEPAAILASA